MQVPWQEGCEPADTGVDILLTSFGIECPIHKEERA